MTPLLNLLAAAAVELELTLKARSARADEIENTMHPQTVRNRATVKTEIAWIS